MKAQIEYDYVFGFNSVVMSSQLRPKDEIQATNSFSQSHFEIVDQDEEIFTLATASELNSEIYKDLYMATFETDYGEPSIVTSRIEIVNGLNDHLRIKKVQTNYKGQIEGIMMAYQSEYGFELRLEDEWYNFVSYWIPSDIDGTLIEIDFQKDFTDLSEVEVYAFH